MTDAIRPATDPAPASAAAAPRVSIIAPMKNEAENVGRLADDIAAACASLAPFEAIFVNDGSDDDTAGAIAAARASIDAQFWPRMEDPRGAELLLVKVAVPTQSGGREHIWVERARRLADGSMTGFLMNEPNDFPGAMGDRLDFAESWISDWMYRLDGKIHGAYTLRVLLPRMHPAQAAEYRATLAPLPE